MRIIKLFKNHILALFVAIGLIVISCNADLALPSFMSEIVDVGIQQGGITSPVPNTIRDDSLSDLELFMTKGDAKQVEDAYSKADKNGVRTYIGSEEDRAEEGKLTSIMSLPETVALSLEQGIDASSMSDMTGKESSEKAGASAPTPEQMAVMTPEELAAMQQKAQAAAKMQEQIDADGGKITMKSMRIAVEGGLVERSKLVEGANKMADEMGSMGGSIVTQRAITYVQQEYEAQGISLSDVQNSYLASTSVKMFSLCAVSLVATILTGAVASHTACTIARDLRRKTFDKVMHFSPAEVGKFSQASLITRCTNDIQQIQMATTLFIRMVMMAPIMGIVAVMRVLATHTGLEWTIGVAVIAVSAVVGVLMGLTMPKFKKMQKYVDRVNLVAREILDGIMPIRAFGRQKHELERFDEASCDLMTTQLFTNRAMSFMMPLMMFVMNCVTVLIVWAGSHGVSDGVMQVGDMMAFIQYTMQIIMSFLMISMMFVMVPRASVSAGRIADVLASESSVQDAPQPRHLPEKVKGLVQFNDVSFHYEGADENVLEHVTFTARPGETTAFIGSTGSGKSTLINLIPRFYDVSAGSVTVDGVDVRDIPQHELRDAIGYVPQKGVLFSGDISSNLRYGGEDADADVLRRAAEAAQATEFIDELPDGFETAISQGGTNVSGGQRQRLSIARALVKKAPVYIFDDTFSALDFKTDAKLRKALKGYTEGATVLIVAQRVSTIMHAEQIVVLDEGRVMGIGTHRELLASCKTYREIAESQLSKEELA